MDERIKEHLMYLNRYYLLLQESRRVPQEAFLDSPVHRGSTERFLHLAIESCLNIGNRLIALHQFAEPITPPNTYADIFKEMHRMGIVDAEFLERLVRMAQFRNRLVHLYWEIDPEAVYGFLQNSLDDFKLFQEKVIEFLSKSQLPPA